MRIKLLVTSIAVVLLLALVGTVTLQAQSQSLNTRESPWQARTVIGLPVNDDDRDDESDDESDDEGVEIPAPIAKTGQTDSYYPGDDGALQRGVTWRCGRFVDNLDGTITDLLTGLLWLKDATTFSAANWNNALSTCNDLADDGVTLTDGSMPGYWRLPNNKELRRLIDFGNSDPALPDGHPFIVPDSGVYWTSTTGTNNTGRAWTIDDGTMLNDPKNARHLIWPVRDACPTGCGTAPAPKTGQIISYGTRDDGELQAGVAWPDPRFIDNLDGTITDALTGLIWLADATRFAGMAFEDALDSCNALADDGIDLTDGSMAGYWRLPNIWELASLPDYGERGPALPQGHPFTVANADTFWSSTTSATNVNRAWTIGIGIGRISALSKNNQNTAWPVRGGDQYDDEYDDECDDIELLPYDDMDTQGSNEGAVGLSQRP